MMVRTSFNVYIDGKIKIYIQAECNHVIMNSKRQQAQIEGQKHWASDALSWLRTAARERERINVYAHDAFAHLSLRG